MPEDRESPQTYFQVTLKRAGLHKHDSLSEQNRTEGSSGTARDRQQNHDKLLVADKPANGFQQRPARHSFTPAASWMRLRITVNSNA